MRRSAMDDLDRAGLQWMRSAVSQGELREIRLHLESLDRPGTRLTPDHPLLSTLRNCNFHRALLQMWPQARLVRALGFQKSITGNWALPWHQDRVIAVKARAEVEGFAAWNQKNGIWHCEAPVSVLQSMLFLRLHLDPNNADTGGMEIALHSHREGFIPAPEAADIAQNHPCLVPEAEAGDLLILPMLTLHRSRPSQGPGLRQVLRLDFATAPLPAPLDWAY